MRKFIVLAALAVSACGGGDQVYTAGVVPQNVKGDADHVSVFNVWTAADAKPLADRHCAKFGKVASFSRTAMITAHFDCVAK